MYSEQLGRGALHEHADFEVVKAGRSSIILAGGVFEGCERHEAVLVADAGVVRVSEVGWVGGVMWEVGWFGALGGCGRVGWSVEG